MSGVPGQGGYGAPAASAGPAPRGKTEVGTPVFMPDSGGAPPPSPYGAPPPMSPQPSGGGYAASAPIPAAPAREAQQSGGGGRGALIGIAAVVALLTIGGVGFAISRGNTRKPVPIVDTTVTSATTEPTAPVADTSATPDPDPSGAAPLGAKPLGGTTPSYTGPAHPVAAHDAGVKPPAGPVTPPAGALSPATIAACAEAADRKKTGKPVNPTANKNCTAGGGKLP